MTLPRVLIVDDAAEPWTTVIPAIQQLGLGTLMCGANSSAAELIDACHAEVVVVEGGTVLRTALELMAVLKAASPEADFIVTASDPSVADVLATYRAGALEVVTRPFQPDELVSAIRRAVKRRSDARDTAALSDEGQRLLTVRERERLPSLAVDFARKAMKADVVSLMLKDAAGRLYIAQAHGLPPQLLAGTRLQIGQRVAGRVAELRAPVLIDDAARSDGRFDDLISFGRVHSSIVHPLLAGDRVLGVLNIGRSSTSQPFTDADLERSGVVAEQISLSLETLRQWQRTGIADRLAIVGQIAGSVAHEINNPLAAIVGQTDLALESVTGLLARLMPGANVPMDELRQALVHVRECLADAREAAGGVQVVAADLRSAVQSQGTQEGVSNLAETIRAAARMATTDVRRRTVITRNIEPTLFVDGDSGLLCQVFLSLILNASQALRAAGTANPEIRIVSSHANGEVRVDVIDNGPGIAPERLTGIFEPSFSDAPSGLRSGFGLSIAYDIVQALGGRMDVVAKPGECTFFAVYLPSATGADGEAASGRSRSMDFSTPPGPS